jgi:hypothetical protein
MECGGRVGRDSNIASTQLSAETRIEKQQKQQQQQQQKCHEDELAL